MQARQRRVREYQLYGDHILVFFFLRSVQLELRNDAWTAEGLVSDLEHVHILQWEWSMAGDVLALPEPVVIAGVVERFRHPGEVAVTVVRVVAEV